MTEELLTTSEAARLLRVKPRTLLGYRDRGLVKAAKLPCGHYRFRREDVLALLEGRDQNMAEQHIVFAKSIIDSEVRKARRA